MTQFFFWSSASSQSIPHHFKDKGKDAPPSSPGSASQPKIIFRSLVGYGGDIQAVAFSFDGLRAVTASSELRLRVWDTNNGRQIRTIEGLDNIATVVAFSPDGRRIVTGGPGKPAVISNRLSSKTVLTHSVIQEWDTENGLLLHKYIDYNPGRIYIISAVAYTRNGSRVVSRDINRNIKVWERETEQVIREIGTDANFRVVDGPNIFQTAFSRNGSHVIYECIPFLKENDFDGGVKEEPLANKSKDLHPKVVRDNPNSIGGNDSGTYLRDWDLELGNSRLIKLNTAIIDSVAISPNCSLIAVGDREHTVMTIDFTSGKSLLKFEERSREGPDFPRNPTGIFGFLAFSSDSSRIVSGCADGIVRVWEARTGRLLETFRAPEKGRIHAADFRSGRLRIISGGAMSPDELGHAFYKPLYLWEANLDLLPAANP